MNAEAKTQKIMGYLFAILALLSLHVGNDVYFAVAVICSNMWTISSSHVKDKQ